MPSGLIFLAEGAEEMELVITADVLRRAGVDVVIAGVAGDGPVKCSNKVTVVPDKSLSEAVSKHYDILICPGGAKGSETLCKSKEVGAALQDQEKRGGFIAAVCAAPTALVAHNIAKGKKLTSYPGMADKFKDYKYLEERVVVDGKLITSRGPGTTFEFALAIVEQLVGKEKVQSLTSGLVLK
uniref:DJ-1/PfpI domain-containing protein n=1 Tax=Biomphalaria glabrata TaxID=6526 RepID=A0A2C9JDD2_BIOGL